MILQVATTIRGDGRYTRKIQKWFYALSIEIGIFRETIDFGEYSYENKIFSRKNPIGFYKVLTNFYIFSGDNQIFRKEMSSGLSFFHLVNSFIRVV